MTVSTIPDDACTITASDGSLVPVPSEFVCPITTDIMMQPLLSKEGHSYERSAILRWVSEHGTSPLTREPLLPTHLVRNRALETRIKFFLLQHGAQHDADEAENASKFMGYVAAPDKLSTTATVDRTMNLGGLTLSSILSLDSNEASRDAVPEEYLTERRRQINNIIADALEAI